MLALGTIEPGGVSVRRPFRFLSLAAPCRPQHQTANKSQAQVQNCQWPASRLRADRPCAPRKEGRTLGRAGNTQAIAPCCRADPEGSSSCSQPSPRLSTAFCWLIHAPCCSSRRSRSGLALARQELRSTAYSAVARPNIQRTQPADGTLCIYIYVHIDMYMFMCMYMYLHMYM